MVLLIPFQCSSFSSPIQETVCSVIGAAASQASGLESSHHLPAISHSPVCTALVNSNSTPSHGEGLRRACGSCLSVAPRSSAGPSPGKGASKCLGGWGVERQRWANIMVCKLPLRGLTPSSPLAELQVETSSMPPTNTGMKEEFNATER